MQACTYGYTDVWWRLRVQFPSTSMKIMKPMLLALRRLSVIRSVAAAEKAVSVCVASSIIQPTSSCTPRRQKSRVDNVRPEMDIPGWKGRG